MRKTRNFLRRAGSAALALTLTVSLCQPAFAATKAPFSKDETVYAVMAADGSVTKTTVSEHLYNADGLAGVEDRSTLKNIVNTESFAEYTRNGDTLVWNTDDTDVYYKGDTDRQLPISAKVTYTLDGRTAPLSELLGKSGHLVLTIDLTNHETGKVTVNGKERTIVTPLVTAVGVVLGEDAGNVNAVNRTPQMMIATIHGDLPVKKGQKLAGTRIIPLVIEQEKMDAMQAAAGSEPILNVLPMQAKKFAVITTGSEVFKGRIEDKFTPILVGKLAEYDCEMTFHKVCDDDPAGITAAILEAKEAGCELIFTTGGMSVDPDDRTPLAIRNTGADIVTYGAPVLPGAMFLVSYLDGVPVCGLPGCVMYAKRTIFDLLLPRLLADDAITSEDIARLGEGGLCLGCAECHWPNCGFGHC